MDPKEKKEERPFSYPQPTEADQQLNNQPEYIDQEPNTYEKKISDLPETKPQTIPRTGED